MAKLPKQSDPKGYIHDKMLDALKDARTIDDHIEAVRGLTGEVYTIEYAKAFLIHLAITALGVSNDSDIVLASWGLLHGYDSKGIGGVENRRNKYIQTTGYEGVENYHSEISRDLTEKELTNLRSGLAGKERTGYRQIIRYYFKMIDTLGSEEEATKTLFKGAKKERMTPDEKSVILPEPFYLKPEFKATLAQPNEEEQDLVVESEISEDTQAADAKEEKDKSEFQQYIKEKLGREEPINIKRALMMLSLIAVAVVAVITIQHFMENPIQNEDAESSLGYEAIDNEDKLPMYFSSGVNTNENAGLYNKLKEELQIKEVTADSIAQYVKKATTTKDPKDEFVAGAYLLLDKQYDEAAKWISSAADKGFTNAKSFLGHLYLNGLGVEKDKDKAFALATEATAEADDDYFGQTLLGQCYQLGFGTEVDYKNAAYWYKKAVALDFPYAKYCLGTLYESGNGVAKDNKKAFQLFLEAYEGGVSLAAFNIAFNYIDGEYVNRDPETGMEWLRVAGEAGVPMAWVFRGNYYYYGVGVEQDYNEAFKCYMNALNQGDNVAEYYISKLYLDGHGTDQNIELGLQYLTSYASRGYTDAQIELAVYYHTGKYCEKNDNLALYWLKLASESGDKNADIYLKEFFPEEN